MSLDLDWLFLAGLIYTGFVAVVLAIQYRVERDKRSWRK